MIELVCAACGRTVMVNNRGGRKYCDECKGLSSAILARIKKEKEEENATAQELYENECRRNDPFNPAWMSERRLGAVIKMFRMTYGTYTAAYRGGFIVQILKAKGFADPEKMLRELEVK